jgi:GH18 family chitinase
MLYITRNRLLLTAVVLLVQLYSGHAVAQAQPFRVVGYFPSWADMTRDIDSLDFSALTHLNWAFKNPDSLGRFTGDDRGLAKLVATAHRANVNVLFSLGGASGSEQQLLIYKKLFASAEQRGRFIREIHTYIRRNSLQGVDVDLEGRAINADYGKFIRQLADSLRPAGLLITAALNGSATDRFEDEIIPLFDWINIMSYDATGSWTPDSPGQHASFEYAREGLQKWRARGTRKDQLVLGVPFYGHAFGKDIKLDYANYNRIVKLFPEAHLRDQAGDVIYYNGIATIRAKTKLALQEASGIMIWALSYDTYDDLSLLRAIKQEVEAHKGTKNR